DTGWSESDKITSNSTIKGVGRSNAVVTIKEGSVIIGTTTTDSTGAWKFTPTDLADGKHIFVASETDQDGDTDMATLIFSFYNSQPQVGTADNDTLRGTQSGLNIIYGLGGNDAISVQNAYASTELYGGDGNDIVHGSIWGDNYI